jgi:hypothetical protein
MLVSLDQQQLAVIKMPWICWFYWTSSSWSKRPYPKPAS